MARHDSLIEGRWRIVETELWDREALNLVVPAYISFDRQGMGEMQLIAIGASIVVRQAVGVRNQTDRAPSPLTGWHPDDLPLSIPFPGPAKRSI